MTTIETNSDLHEQARQAVVDELLNEPLFDPAQIGLDARQTVASAVVAGSLLASGGTAHASVADKAPIVQLANEDENQPPVDWQNETIVVDAQPAPQLVPPEVPEATTSWYSVLKGDTMLGVLDGAIGVPVDDLAAIDALIGQNPELQQHGANRIFPNQEVRGLHVVQSGDSIYSIVQGVLPEGTNEALVIQVANEFADRTGLPRNDSGHPIIHIDDIVFTPTMTNLAEALRTESVPIDTPDLFDLNVEPEEAAPGRQFMGPEDAETPDAEQEQPEDEATPAPFDQDDTPDPEDRSLQTEPAPEAEPEPAPEAPNVDFGALAEQNFPSDSAVLNEVAGANTEAALELGQILAAHEASGRLSFADSTNNRVEESFREYLTDGDTFIEDIDRDPDAVELSEVMLYGILDFLDADPSHTITINSITTGIRGDAHDGHSENSLHYVGRAIDIGGSAEQRQAFMDFILSEPDYLNYTYELIYGSAEQNFSVYRGSASDRATNHLNHVHWGISTAELETPPVAPAPESGWVPVEPEAEPPVPEVEPNDEPASEEALADDIERAHSLLSETYHEVMAQKPTLEYAIANYDFPRHRTFGPQYTDHDTALLAYLGGFRGEDLQIAIALSVEPDPGIAGAESNNSPFVINSNAGRMPGFHEDTIAVGPMQMLYNPDWAHDPAEAIRDPRANLDPITNYRNAVLLKERQGWDAWEAYREGEKHVPNMPKAQRLIDWLESQGIDTN